jgi:signal transduction histidine kinase
MPLTTMRDQSVSCRLRPEPALVRHAREQARKALYEWDLGEHAELCELIVSELVTNAICHGDGEIQVRMSHACGDLRVEVHDDGTGRPVRRQPTAEDESGRGLALLDGLIGLHGGSRGIRNDLAGDGKAVYVVIRLPADPAGVQ